MNEEVGAIVQAQVEVALMGAAPRLPGLGLGQQTRPSVPRAIATCQAWTWPPHHDPHWGRGGCSADGLGGL